MIGRWLADPRVRAVLWQFIAVAAVAWLGLAIVSNTLANLESRGIVSGFGFMSSTAGFGVPMSLVPFNEGSTFARAFVVGLLNTLLVSALGIAIATVLGFVVGLGRLSRNWLVARIAGAYVETIRNIPLLLQIFFWYFAVLRSLPAPRASIDIAGVAFLNNRGLYVPWPTGAHGTVEALGLVALGLAILAALRLAPSARPAWRRGGRILGGLLLAGGALWAVLSVGWDRPRLTGFNFRGGASLIPEFVALVVALSTYTAAFIAEIVRAGVQAVPRGQVEAAEALGLSRIRTLRLVIVPQALRVIVPPLTNQYLNLTKNSSLATAIAYPDLVSVFGGTVLNITGQAIEVIAITMGVYLLISLAIAWSMNRYNRSLSVQGG